MLSKYNVLPSTTIDGYLIEYGFILYHNKESSTSIIINQSLFYDIQKSEMSLKPSSYAYVICWKDANIDDITNGLHF